MKGKIFLCLVGLLLILIGLDLYAFRSATYESSFLTVSFLGAALFTWGVAKKKKRKVIVRETRPVSTPQRIYPPSSGRLRVGRGNVPYWEEQGWQEVNGRYIGRFIGKYQGEAIPNRDKFQFFVINPPSGIRYHPHWECFKPRGNGRFFVHFLPPKPKNLDSGILAIENILREAERC